jgi:hypothetical protein
MRLLIVMIALAVVVAFTAATETVAQGPIKIGFIAPLSGAIAQAGKDMYSGCELFWEETGWQLGGRKLEVILEDNEGVPATALTRARKLAESDHVHMLAGVILSNVAYALVPYIESQGIPTIYPINSADDLTQRRAEDLGPAQRPGLRALSDADPEGRRCRVRARARSVEPPLRQAVGDERTQGSCPRHRGRYPHR